MSGFPILDLVVGIVFIYFLLSVISSSVVEMILTALKARAKLLEEWLKKIFDKVITQPDGTEISLGQAIMDHCANTALMKPGKAPSYIDAKNFTSSLLEKITYDPQNPKSIAKDMTNVITAIENTSILSTELQRVLLNYAYDARDTYAALSTKTISEVEYFRAKVENWYDTTMDRLTGNFKRRYTQPFTLLIAAIIAIGLNADSIAIAKYLYSNPDVRAKIMVQAYQEAKDSTFIRRLNQIHVKEQDSVTLDQFQNAVNNTSENIQEANAVLNGAFPLGWKSKANTPTSFLMVLSKIGGLLATILAIFMGAPFWFDILNKIANLRGTGPKPASSTDGDFNKAK